MNFIDWTDAEGMVDLYQEFVRDELNSADRDRQVFLSRILGGVRSAREGNAAEAIGKLREIRDSIENEFSSDPAATHLTDLIAELEGLR